MLHDVRIYKLFVLAYELSKIFACTMYLVTKLALKCSSLEYLYLKSCISLHSSIHFLTSVVLPSVKIFNCISLLRFVIDFFDFPMVW